MRFLISDIPNIFRLDLSAPVDKPLSYALTMIETFIFEKCKEIRRFGFYLPSF